MLAVKNRTGLVWVEIDRVVPNPLNPRKDHAVKTEEMQEILRKRGWEEGITAYKQGQYYVILSGHRRWHAAKQMEVKEVPVYEVSPPESDQETVERMASLQYGHVDWTKYEWAKFVYNAWLYWGKPPIKNDFEKIIQLHRDTIRDYIDIFEFFPKEEIEDNLEKGGYSIKGLSALSRWLKRAKNEHPELIKNMSEALVRKMMLQKMSNGLLGSETVIKTDEFISIANEKQVKDFLATPNMSLKQAQAIVGATVPAKADAGKFQSVMQRISYLIRDVRDVVPKDKTQTETFLSWLDSLEKEIKKKRKQLKS